MAEGVAVEDHLRLLVCPGHYVTDGPQRSGLDVERNQKTQTYRMRRCGSSRSEKRSKVATKFFKKQKLLFRPDYRWKN